MDINCKIINQLKWIGKQTVPTEWLGSLLVWLICRMV